MEAKRNDYPFVRCLSPKVIRNPYTQEQLIVPCGDCEACRLDKSSQSVLKVKLEALAHKFTLFVTLTYDQESLPKAIVCDGVQPDERMLVTYSPRCGQGEILSSWLATDSDVNLVLDKVNLNGYIPYLCKRDLQLFMKRLRKNLKDNGIDEKIRYYACGEYGPVHFRPHYHLLLWFEEKQTLKVIQENLSKVWRFGRISADVVSSGDCSRYVAGYVNGSSNLPKVFRYGECKPFSCHSFFLGEAVLRLSRKEMYETPIADVIKRCINIDGTCQDVTLWRSLKTYYFPKCKRYNKLSMSERLYAYKAFNVASYWTKETSPFRAAKAIVNHIAGDDLFGYNDCAPRPELQTFLDWIIDWHPIAVSKIRTNREAYRTALMSVYTTLRISYQFLKFVVDDEFNPNEICAKLLKIDEFWKYCDYLNLTTNLERQVFYSENYDCQSEDDFVWFYNNPRTSDGQPLVTPRSPYMLDSLQFNRAYKQFKARVKERAAKAVKHKNLNDANLIFNYI